jgi:hypothetical protein
VFENGITVNVKKAGRMILWYALRHINTTTEINPFLIRSDVNV